MKANNPITARVQAAFKNLTTPTNQEVTLNADGSGGPIVAPDGRVVNKPKKKQKSSTEDCGCAGSAKGAAAPAKQKANLPKEIVDAIAAKEGKDAPAKNYKKGYYGK
jgi:hypothetical protein